MKLKLLFFTFCHGEYYNRCDTSESYKGSVNTTRRGFQCQNWQKNSPHEVKIKPINADHNYCRNPDGDPRGPWCYTTGEIKWDYCFIPQCECVHTCIPNKSNGYSYNGEISSTKSGYNCQRWDTDYPHTIRAFPFDRKNNFCRNPDNDPKGPWCYTRNPHKRWEYCDVPVCESEIVCKNNHTHLTTTTLVTATSQSTTTSTSSSQEVGMVISESGRITPSGSDGWCGMISEYIFFDNNMLPVTNHDRKGHITGRSLFVDSNMISSRAYPVDLAVNPYGGARTKSKNRIVNGQNAPVGTLPHQVALRMTEYKSIIYCGGTIISKYYVLTAAHCTDGRDKNGIIVSAGHILRQLRSAEKENTYQELSLEAIIEHPQFDSIRLRNDISIMKVKNGFLWSQAVQPACLPSSSINIELEINKDQKKSPVCVVSGWGNTEGTSSNAHLQVATVPLISLEDCSVMNRQTLRRDNICAGYDEGGIDACQGDSGGPLVCLVEGRWQITGVVSWGIGCADERQPGVYANVKHFLTWITDVKEKCFDVTSSSCKSLAINNKPR